MDRIFIDSYRPRECLSNDNIKYYLEPALNCYPDSEIDLESYNYDGVKIKVITKDRSKYPKELFSVFFNSLQGNCGIAVFSNLATYRGGYSQPALVDTDSFDFLKNVIKRLLLLSYDLNFTSVLWTVTLSQVMKYKYKEVFESLGFERLEEFKARRTKNTNYVYYLKLKEEDLI